MMNQHYVVLKHLKLNSKLSFKDKNKRPIYFKIETVDKQYAFPVVNSHLMLKTP